MNSTPRFHDKIKAALDERGKSQSLLAEFLHLSPGHLSRTLKGERPLDHATLVKIADFLDTTPADLAAGTEVEDLARPAGALVERDTYEDLLAKLQEASQRAASLESELAAERERRTLAETASADCRTALAAREEEARSAQARAASERDKAEEAGERARAAERALEEAKARIQKRDAELARVRGELTTCQRQAATYAADVDEKARQIAGLRREVQRLGEHLAAANATVTRNYDAYVQAEAGRRALAQQLQAQQQNATAAAVFTGLIGLGAGLLGGSSRRDDDDDDL